MLRHLSSHDLPQELSDHIIDYLRYDPETLKSCSLVCKSWLFSSRIHLFHRLIFDSEDADTLASLIIGPPRSSIPHYNKKLEFIGCTTLFENGLIPTLLPLFFSTTTHIKLADIVLDNFSGLLDILCAFPCLQSVALERVHWDGPDPGLHDRQWLPPTISHLRLKHIDLTQFVTWLLSHPTLPMPTRFELGPVEEHHVPCVGQYLQLVGPVVKHLEFLFGYGENGHICSHDLNELLRELEKNNARPDESSLSPGGRLYWSYYGLSSCDRFSAFSALETLRIDSFINVSASHQSAATFWTPRILSSVRSQQCRLISLGLAVPRAGDLDQFNVKWDFLDKVLTTSSYPNLQCVEFEVCGRVSIDGVASLLSNRLPLLANRKLLEFRRSKP